MKILLSPHFAGKVTGNESLTLIGQSLLGTIEKEHSMQEVYQTPWGMYVFFDSPST